MAIREIIAQVLLYDIIALLGISIGGNVYEMLVLTPLWSASPPDSVAKFFKDTPFARAMQKFWLSKLAKYSLFVLLGAAIAAWNVPARRAWLVAVLAITAARYALTIRYIFPRKKILFRSGGELSAEQIQRVCRQFITADRLRLALNLIAFVCLLRALSIH